MAQLYVLKLEGGRYYIGKTDTLAGCFQEHLHGRMGTWTQKFPPIRIEHTQSYGRVEDMVKHYMREYGINYVRGDGFETEFTKERELQLISELYPPNPEIAVVNAARTLVSDVLGGVSGLFGAASQFVKPSEK